MSAFASRKKAPAEKHCEDVSRPGPTRNHKHVFCHETRRQIRRPFQSGFVALASTNYKHPVDTCPLRRKKKCTPFQDDPGGKKWIHPHQKCRNELNERQQNKNTGRAFNKLQMREDHVGGGLVGLLLWGGKREPS